MSKVTMKSTKEQIMNEVVRLEAELKAQREASKTVTTIKAEKETAERSNNAKAVIGMNILNDTIVKGYNDVMFAIENARKELAEIQGVQEAIIDAEAVIMAKDALIADRESKEVIRIAELKAEAEKIIAEKEARIKELNQQYLDEKAALEKERKREAEEFAYKQKRERQIDNDKWADEKAAREKELAEKEEGVIEREIAVADKERELIELTSKVQEIPTLVAAAKEEGKAEAEKQLAKEKAIEVNAVKKNSEWEIKMANMERDRAKEDLDKANEKIATLEAKLAAAYESMNTLATTTVQSTGGVKILETGKDK